MLSHTAVPSSIVRVPISFSELNFILGFRRKLQESEHAIVQPGAMSFKCRTVRRNAYDEASHNTVLVLSTSLPYDLIIPFIADVLGGLYDTKKAFKKITVPSWASTLDGMSYLASFSCFVQGHDACLY